MVVTKSLIDVATVESLVASTPVILLLRLLIPFPSSPNCPAKSRILLPPPIPAPLSILELASAIVLTVGAILLRRPVSTPEIFVYKLLMPVPSSPNCPPKSRILLPPAPFSRLELASAIVFTTSAVALIVSVLVIPEVLLAKVERPLPSSPN